MVVKHNALVRATYNMSLEEHRLMLMCISKVKRMGDNPSRQFSITHAEYAKEFDVVDSYKGMRNAARRLQRRSVILNEDIEINGKIYNHSEINILSAQFWQTGEGEILLEFSDRFMPFLAELSKDFTKYFVADVKNFSSTHTLHIYELCKMHYNMNIKNESKHNLLIDIDGFRQMLGVKNKYKLFSELRKYVIERSLAEINDFSPLHVEYEKLTAGRKVTKLVFKVASKSASKKSITAKNQKKLEELVKGVIKAFNSGKRVTIKGKVVESTSGDFTVVVEGSTHNLYAILKDNPKLKDEIKVEQAEELPL